MSGDLTARLRRDPIKVECPICRHRQWIKAPAERCEQCGSEITLYENRDTASVALDAVVGEGRVAYLRDLPGELFAVVANRSFRKKT